MGHGIDTNRDFQYGLEEAWHKLTRLAKKLTREMFPSIRSEQLYYNGGKELASWRVPVSEDDMLPVGEPSNGSTYALFTPHEAWDYCQEVLAGTKFTVESLGMLKNRRLWFMAIHLDELKDVGTAEHRYFLNFSGGLNRQFSPQADLVNFKAICFNTVSASRASGQWLFKTKATKNFKVRLDSARQEIENAVGMAKVFNATLEKLGNQKCGETRAERIYAGYLAPENADELSTKTRNTVGELVDLYRLGDGNRGESLLDVFNGFTQLRTRGSIDSQKSRWSQFESSEFGLYADQKAEFFNVVSDANRLENVAERGRVLLAL